MEDQRRRADDIQIGMLIQSVQTLTEEVNSLRADVSELKAKVNTGKGVFWGALFVAGGMGAGLSQLVDRFFN